MTGAAFRFGNTPFYFLRHGETDDGKLGIVQGQHETVAAAAIGGDEIRAVVPDRLPARIEHFHPHDPVRCSLAGGGEDPDLSSNPAAGLHVRRV